MWRYHIFTCEDIVSFLTICYHSEYHWLLYNKDISYIDTSVLLENIPLVKFIKIKREFIDDFIDIKFVP